MSEINWKVMELGDCMTGPTCTRPGGAVCGGENWPHACILGDLACGTDGEARQTIAYLPAQEDESREDAEARAHLIVDSVRTLASADRTVDNLTTRIVELQDEVNKQAREFARLEGEKQREHDEAIAAKDEITGKLVRYMAALCPCMSCDGQPDPQRPGCTTREFLRSLGIEVEE